MKKSGGAKVGHVTLMLVVSALGASGRRFLAPRRVSGAQIGALPRKDTLAITRRAFPSLAKL